MSQKPNTSGQSDNGEPINGEQVETYLREHPEFFQHKLDLLAILELPHPTNGQAVSLIQRQMALLREQNSNLERKLNELIEIARENERLSMRLHKFSNSLLETRTISDVLAVTHDEVRQLFNTDFVSLKLYEEITDEPALYISKSLQTSLYGEFIAEGKPACGRISRRQLEPLFADDMDRIVSSAMIPLKANRNLGILALASTEKDRFNPSMGHFFLSHLGDLVSSALACHI